MSLWIEVCERFPPPGWRTIVHMFHWLSAGEETTVRMVSTFPKLSLSFATILNELRLTSSSWSEYAHENIVNPPKNTAIRIHQCSVSTCVSDNLLKLSTHLNVFTFQPYHTKICNQEWNTSSWNTSAYFSIHLTAPWRQKIYITWFNNIEQQSPLTLLFC